jgi:hypothetical protein
VESAESLAELRAALQGQYQAGLSELASSIRRCPEELWTSRQFRFPFWRVGYHTLFYTHFYSAPDEKSFTPWASHRKDAQFQEATPWPPHTLPELTPYTVEDLLGYAAELHEVVRASLQGVRFDDPSGFSWLRLNKLELHLYNIRHLEHHTGQLVDRLRNAAGITVDWVGKGRRE